jgi:hypothetical protein
LTGSHSLPGSALFFVRGRARAIACGRQRRCRRPARQRHLLLRLFSLLLSVTLF